MKRLDWPYRNLQAWKQKSKHMLEEIKIGLIRRKAMGIRTRDGTEGDINGRAGQ